MRDRHETSPFNPRPAFLIFVRRAFVAGRALEMLTCLPQSLCTWDFRVLGASAEPASVTFNFLTEQGGVVYGKTHFEIRKHGWLSGRWSLESGGTAYADAQKLSVFSRAFEVREAETVLTLRAESPLTRGYEILSGSSVLGTIRPAHPFTRRASIECASQVSELAQLFCFWLAALTWRRASNSSGSP